MSRADKDSRIDPAVVKAVKDLLASATTFEEKTKAIDRALKLEQIKAKLQDDEFGTDFDLSSDQ